MSHILNFQTASSGQGGQKRLQPLFKDAEYSGESDGERQRHIQSWTMKTLMGMAMTSRFPWAGKSHVSFLQTKCKILQDV